MSVDTAPVLWMTYGRLGGVAHIWDGESEPSGEQPWRLVRVARCGFLMDYGIAAYQHLEHPIDSEQCPRCLKVDR